MSTASAFVDTAPETQLKSEVRASAKAVAGPSTLLARIANRKTTQELYQLVADRFEITIEELLSPERTKHIVGARHVLAWLLRQQGLSLPAVARNMSYCDHTSAMHAVRRVERDRQASPEVAQMLEELMR